LLSVPKGETLEPYFKFLLELNLLALSFVPKGADALTPP